MVKAAVMVDEPVLQKMLGYPNNVLEAVEHLLNCVRYKRSTEFFKPSDVIPDDAPEKVKNETAKGNGQCFKVGVNLPYDEKQPEDNNICFSWYESYDRRYVVVWEITWPVKIIEE